MKKEITWKERTSIDEYSIWKNIQKSEYENIWMEETTNKKKQMENKIEITKKVSGKVLIISTNSVLFLFVLFCVIHILLYFIVSLP